MTICNSWFFLSSSFCSLQQRDGKKQNKNTLNALFLFPWLVRLKKKQEKLKHSVEYWSTPFNERTLIMSSRWVSERALTASGSSSTIVDRSWAMILSLAWSSLHKCLVSLLASDSNDEQVDVLSPRWLGRMVAVAADCRLVLGNKKRKWKKTQSASVQIVDWSPRFPSLTCVYYSCATSNFWGRHLVSFERCRNRGLCHWLPPMRIPHHPNRLRDLNLAIPILLSGWFKITVENSQKTKN